MFWVVMAGAAWVVAALGRAMLSDLLSPHDHDDGPGSPAHAGIDPGNSPSRWRT